jgi:pilus assembly protein Flp/PilA
MDLMVVWQGLRTFIRARARSERGASLVEYALLVALVGVACTIAVAFVGTSASSTISGAGNSINPGTSRPGVS